MSNVQYMNVSATETTVFYVFVTKNQRKSMSEIYQINAAPVIG